MTRINAGIHPSELPDKLLIAEHREITRIANVRFSNSYDGPFKLGKGHVLFFAQRMGYIKRRYFQLLSECYRRGFKVTDKSAAFEGKDGPDWDDAEARLLVLERIHSKNFSLLSERNDKDMAGQSGFRVRHKRCSTCIYNNDSPLDLKKLEDQIKDPHGGFASFRVCHHTHGEEQACCHGFWSAHKDEFAIGQIAQRLGMVEFVDTDVLATAGIRGGSICEPTN